jgi:hypothetical protein
MDICVAEAEPPPTLILSGFFSWAGAVEKDRATAKRTKPNR